MKIGIKWLAGFCIAVALVCGTKINSDAYLIDVGSISMGQYVDQNDSSGWAGVYLASSYDLTGVSISVNELVMEYQTFAANFFMSDPIVELLTPLDVDGNTTITAINFTGNLANEIFTYGSGQVRATGGIQSYWQYYDPEFNLLDSKPEYLGLGDFASLLVDVEDVQPVPEPSTIILLAAGAACLFALKRRN